MYRFASAPTGDMHVDELRVALFNYICAKQSGDMFIVRIADADKARNIEGKDQEILDILAIFGITYDRLYYQSENFKYHLQFASSLLDSKKAFACFCTEEELEAKREKALADKKPYTYDGKCLHVSNEELLNNNLPFTIRIKKPETTITFKDTIKGTLSFAPDKVDSFVIMTKNKYPTYNFACATDDMIQGVKYIIREEDQLSNTPRQEHIRKAFGYDEEIRYAHLPVILNVTGESSVQSLLAQGILPEALSNYLILLGNQTPTEIFSLDDALKWFTLENISQAPTAFDSDKLRFLNREHIKLIEDVELSKRVGYSCSSIGKLAKLYTQEVSTMSEIKQKIDSMFSAKHCEDEFSESLKTLINIVQSAPYFPEFDEFKKYLADESGLKGKHFLKPLRFLLTGAENGPDLADLYPLIKNYLQEIAR